MSWATSDPDANFQFAETSLPRQERRIKILAVVSAVLLPVTVAMYYLLPPSPAAAVTVGLLWGFGASIPIGILLALLTERILQKHTRVIRQEKPFVIRDDGGEYVLFYPQSERYIAMDGKKCSFLVCLKPLIRM